MTIDKGFDRESSKLTTLLSWMVTLLVPIIVILASVRLMLLPLYLQWEYNAPGFPPDAYGFTTQERIYWANIAREYLLNDADISFLGDLEFEDGTPVYNPRELLHMVDVKSVLQIALFVWYLSLVVMLLLGAWAWLGKWFEDYRVGLARGGWLTVFLVGAIIAVVLVSFGVFFVAFHNVFFEPGTWRFAFSDTLIRLFPERFWRDIFIFVGLLSLGMGLILALAFRPRSKPAMKNDQ